MTRTITLNVNEEEWTVDVRATEREMTTAFFAASMQQLGEAQDPWVVFTVPENKLGCLLQVLRQVAEQHLSLLQLLVQCSHHH